MTKGTKTRSGLLWEVERLLDECSQHSNLPKVLLMENVPQVHGSNNIRDFQDWVYKLEQLGYTNYCEDLNAKDYGIPQSRDRCFMVSILGKYHYKFPRKIPLELRLKNMLEDKVDEKYYLSNETIERISKWKAQQKPLENILNDESISPTLTTRGAGEEHSGMVLYSPNEIVDFISSYNFNKTNIGNQIVPTLITVPKFGVVDSKNNTLVSINAKANIKNVMTDCATTLETNCGSSTSADGGVVAHNLRIRKLTPLECWRLMGFADEDFIRAQKSGISNCQLYKQAGNSIVVNVLMAIFKQMI